VQPVQSAPARAAVVLPVSIWVAKVCFPTVSSAVYSKSGPSGAPSGIASPLGPPLDELLVEEEPLLDDEPPPDEPLLEDEPPLDEEPPPDEPLLEDEPPLDEEPPPDELPLPPESSEPEASTPPSLPSTPGPSDDAEELHALSAAPPSRIANTLPALCMPRR
jgi:hypothetical protein